MRCRFHQLLLLVLVSLLTSCGASRLIPDNHYLLSGVTVKSESKDIDAATLATYVRQKPNSKWFSLFKIPLGTYSMAGQDTTKWLNRTLRNMGEKPVLFDSVQARLSCMDLRSAMQNMGYMHAQVDLKTSMKRKKMYVTYILKPGTPFYIHSLKYDIQDTLIAEILKSAPQKAQLKSGDRFTVDKLDQERRRITQYLMDRGYYRFHRDFIVYSADSARNSNDVNITLHLLPYRENSKSPETQHKSYTIRNIFYLSGNEDGKLPLRKSVLENSTAMRVGELYNYSKLQRTYNNFAKLQTVRYTNINFKEIPDSSLLDCDIKLSTNKPNTISFQPEGTNTAGDLGAAASLIYSDRNLFHGSELLTIQLRAAFEAITGLEGYQNQNYVEYNLETKLQFPRFVAPFLSNSFKRNSNATSELAVSYNLQNRPEFHRRVFTTAWRYRWNEPHHHLSYRLDVLDLNYVHMPWISKTFKFNYLDSISNSILRYNYEDLFIMKIGMGVTYNDGINAIRANVETAGNLLNSFSHIAGTKKNQQGQYTLFNIAYAQYAKFDFDFTHLIQFDLHNQLALHFGLGIAWPYGNSSVLPFEKRYFSGGANSVRGWSVRELGPGKYRGTDGRIDFINQTGDMKLDINVEYRTSLFWKLNGALFVDAGNIWTLRNYAEQPGGQFQLDSFYQQLAVAYGLGLRLNFDYFILRFDMGMKAINPAYTTQEEHYAIFHPKWSRDFAFHFAVGFPF
ncbi:BamA/TamA family outer membrane protein [Prevotella sp. S7 MS 2]|uniref:translocation and assembly module lipoprotein TamL n=1 Tax=Prevotella sp. S7 MS 2 TaxID=1287488 RepID=UPI0005145F23|nr:BamA/TamA family outer membrane protein [Prevotella sp. S7 MS 2]KGI60225.1 membrane protein [Prevotella sp. S7 MS 2]